MLQPKKGSGMATDQKPEERVRYPTLREKPRVDNIKDLAGGDWWKATIRRNNGKKADGFAGTPQDAADKAYRAAGGTVNEKVGHKF